MNPENTLAEAKVYLRENWDDGVDCPCCGRLVKRYTRKLHTSMALVLLYLYHIDKETPNEFVDVLREVQKRYNLNAATTHYQKLRFWHLIESSKESNMPTTKSRGYWRITDSGKRFVEGIIQVPHEIYQYDNKYLGCSEEKVTIQSALTDNFNYQELMGDYFTPNKQGSLL